MTTWYVTGQDVDEGKQKTVKVKATTKESAIAIGLAKIGTHRLVRCSIAAI